MAEVKNTTINTEIDIEALMAEEKRERKANRGKKPGSFLYICRRVWHTPTAMVGVGIIVIMYILSYSSPFICKFPFAKVDIMHKYALPGVAGHLLGCDELGRDILSRCLYGARYTMSIGIFSTAFTQVLAIPLGAIAGFFGGIVDTLIMRFLDVFQAFPQILLAIAIACVLGIGFNKIIIALGISGIAGSARMMRAQILSVREQEYVEAATSIGCSTPRIIAKHIVPNAISPLIITMAMGVAGAGLAASSLSFLGFGVQPPNPEWGNMLANARNYVRDYPHMVVIPGIFIMATVLSYNMIGDAVRDALDPRLKD